MIVRKTFLSEEELYLLIKLGVRVCVLKRLDEDIERDQFFWVLQSVWESRDLQIVHVFHLHVS